MALLLEQGDYVPDGVGGLVPVTGLDELAGRVIFKLRARRGAFPLLPELGSRLYLLHREKPGAMAAAARQYVAEALAGEPDLTVTDVAVDRDTGAVEVHLAVADKTLTVTLV